MGIADDGNHGDCHEHDAKQRVEQAAAAILRLFLGGAGDLGVNVTGGVKLLTGFLFSGCTHF